MQDWPKLLLTLVLIPFLVLVFIGLAGLARALSDLYQEHVRRRQQLAMQSAPSRQSTARTPLQFSIETLLLLTTLAAVCLGVTVSAPPLGLWLFAISAAALVRTLIVGKQYQSAAMPFPAAEKISEFVISVGIMIVALVVWFLTLLAIGCSGGLAMAMLGEDMPPPSSAPVLQSALIALFWLAVIFIPLATGGWFIWITRPRG